MNRFRRWLWLILIFVGIVLFLLWYHPILESGIPKDASNWVEKQTGADFQGFSLMETRQYAPFLLLLGHGNSGESAYLLSYEQILFLPIYRRYMLVSNAERVSTGIGLQPYAYSRLEAMLTPPYDKILVRVWDTDGSVSLVP